MGSDTYPKTAMLADTGSICHWAAEFAMERAGAGGYSR